MLLGVVVITMIEGSVFNGCLSVMVLFWKNFLVLDRLNCGVVMVLVNLSVLGYLCLFSSLFIDSLLFSLMELLSHGQWCHGDQTWRGWS